MNLREVLRSCRDRIWWTEPHFVPKLLEFLNYEGDPDRISEIHILTGLPGEDQEDFLNRGKADFKRFRKEMAEKGITAEWRVYQDRPAQHDRYLLERSKVWNMPPLNTLLRGDYSEIIETQNRPPFEGWWDEAKPL